MKEIEWPHDEEWVLEQVMIDRWVWADTRQQEETITAAQEQEKVRQTEEVSEHGKYLCIFSYFQSLFTILDRLR